MRKRGREIELAGSPRKWQVSSTHWVKYRRVPWLLRLVVKEIHSICQLKELHVRITLTSRISNTSGVAGIWTGKTRQKQESPKLNRKSTLPRQNITRSICSIQHHITDSCERGKRINRHTYCNKLNSNKSEKCRHTITYRLEWFQCSVSQLNCLLSTFPACWPLPGSCCQLACFNNGSQVIRLLSHTLFTSCRTGRPLALILGIYTLKVKVKTA